MDLSKYYAEICKTKNISPEEERELFLRYNSPDCPQSEKDSIKSHIISSNMRFAFKQAKYHSKNDPGSFAVLVSAANEGLVIGFDKFDHLSGYRYLSYAGWWVNQRILKEMSQMRIVSLPIWKQQLATRIQKAKNNNESITLEELKKEFPTVRGKDVEELFTTTYLTYYIDDLDEETFLQDDVLDEVERSSDDNKVWKAVSALPSPHREVLAKIFGLEDGEEHSIPSLCKSLKIPKETLRKIHEEGLSMLRKDFKIPR